MRLPSGATAAPWLTSIPSMIPITLLVTGSIRWTLSPALLVWTITTRLPAACGDSVIRHTAAPTASDRRIHRVFIIARSICRALVRLSEDEGPQHLPFRIVLGREMLPAAVIEVAAGFFLDRMQEQAALRI